MGYSAGQKVAVDLGRYIQEWHIGTVVRITPTKWVVVSVGTREYTYKPNRDGTYSSELSDVTPEIAAVVERRRLLHSIETMKWDDVSAEVLRKIAELIKGG